MDTAVKELPKIKLKKDSGEITFGFSAFLEENEPYINGSKVLARAKRNKRIPAGYPHAELLIEQQKQIPEECRKFNLLFTGDDSLIYLTWLGTAWILEQEDVSSAFDSTYLIVHIESG